MRKRVTVAGLVMCLLICMCPISIFAAGGSCPNCGGAVNSLGWEGDIGVSLGVQGEVDLGFVKYDCDSCDYTRVEWSFMGVRGSNEYPNGFITDQLRRDVEAWFHRTFGDDAKVESTPSGPTGAGRRPTGYTDDGIPAIDTNGNLIVSVSHDYAAVKYWQSSYSEKLYYCSDSKRTSNLVLSDYSIALSYACKNNHWSVWRTDRYDDNGNKRDVFFNYQWSFVLGYTVIAPATGYYTLYGSPAFHVAYSAYNGDGTVDTPISYSKHLYSKGEQINFSCGTNIRGFYSMFSVDPVYLVCEPVEMPSVQNNITINNKTFNGNIYVDNSTNLTYIYPQYTQITETGDTVTNISNNPIIYDSTTNQFVTYDQTTNNYYYITYVNPTPAPGESPAPTAMPTPAPTSVPTLPPALTPTPVTSQAPTASPAPSPSSTAAPGFTPAPAPTPTPAPEQSPAPSASPAPSPSNTAVPEPTPTPVPPPSGGGSGSGGGNDSSGSDSSNSWWQKLLDKLGDSLLDGLLDTLAGIFKGILGLIGKIISWIIWLVSQVTVLLPFLPPGLGSLIIGGIVICVFIGIIKFFLR